MDPLPSIALTDCHFHVFDRTRAMAGARYVPAYDAPLAAWRQGAEGVGITRGVLVQTSFLGTDNSRLLEELRRHPGLLRGVAVVAPDAPASLLQELDSAGVRGIRLNLAGSVQGVAPWRRAAPLWDALLDLGWHVELHTDRGDLPGVLAALPAGLPLVIDHMGKPAAATPVDATVRSVAQRARSAPVHVKLSGAYRLEGVDPMTLAQCWLGELGPAALLWGSDWPCTNHERHADWNRLFGALHEWLDAPAAEAALGTNPDRLYWAGRS